MSRTKYSYELKYKTICEVKKGKTISQVVKEFNLPFGGSLLRHWVKRYKHPAELLLNKDFDNEEAYQKQLETRENLQFVAIKQLKEKAKNDNIVLKRLIKIKKEQEKETNQQVIILKKEIERLTKINQVLDQKQQVNQNVISELKFQLYQGEGLKIDNLALKRENKKLSNLIAKLAKENQEYHQQKETEKMKQTVIKETRKQILGSGSYHE